MKSFLCIAFILLIASSPSSAQTGPEQRGREVQVWVGGGHSVAGGRGDTGVFNAGLRYGWILTGPHLPGFLRGRFEYAVDAVPVFLVFQPANTAYGVGFDPLGLKWNFERHGPGRTGHAHPRREAQRKSRTALHAHLQRRTGESESGRQYRAGTAGNRKILRPARSQTDRKST